MKMTYKIQLSPKKILNKQFQIDFKGYNAEEVDYFLDLVLNDYETFAAMLNDSYVKIDNLEKANEELKQQINQLEKEKMIQNDQLQTMEDNLSTNVDILKRISALEKAVFKDK